MEFKHLDVRKEKILKSWEKKLVFGSLTLFPQYFSQFSGAEIWYLGSTNAVPTKTS